VIDVKSKRKNTSINYKFLHKLTKSKKELSITITQEKDVIFHFNFFGEVEG
jgi:hypothetical protein